MLFFGIFVSSGHKCRIVWMVDWKPCGNAGVTPHGSGSIEEWTPWSSSSAEVTVTERELHVLVSSALSTASFSAGEI